MEGKFSIISALKLNFDNEYQRKTLKEAKEQYDLINTFHKCECYVTASDRGNETYYLEHYNMYLINDTCRIQIRYNSYDKKYVFFYDESFKNLSHYQISDIRSKFNAPRRVGKLSKKKIADWIKYESDVYKACKEKDKSLNDNVSIFLNSIKNEDVRFYKKDEKNNVYVGEIITNGIKFSFNIENGYITKKIDVDYSVDRTLEVFKQLSDNKLK